MYYVKNTWQEVMKQTTPLGLCLSILLVVTAAETGYPAGSESASGTTQSTPQSPPGAQNIRPQPGLLHELPGYMLIGIISGNPEDARAVFEDVNSKQQKLYRVGEAVAGATLVEIKRQQVVLKKGGEVVVVQISEEIPRERTAGDPIPVPMGSEDPRKALQQVLAEQMDPTDPQVEKKEVSQPELHHLLQFLNRQAEETNVFAATSLGPAIKLDRMDQEILTYLGLKPSDLIIGISGMGLDSKDRITQIIEVLNRAKVFNLSVLRGRVVQPLYYSVQSDM